MRVLRECYVLKLVLNYYIKGSYCSPLKPVIIEFVFIYSSPKKNDSY